jgi:UDP-3-O-[3-hydroxymyristoyl] glucosamine N-acyltransferase
VSFVKSSAAFSLGELAQRIGASLEGSPDASVRGVAGLDEAREGDLTFLAHPKYRSALATTHATAVIAAPGVECPPTLAVLRASDPYSALAKVLMLFEPAPVEPPEPIHPSAILAPGATIGEGVTIGPYTVLEAEAQVGAGSRLSAHVHVSGEAVIGEDCLLHARAYLGRRCVLGDRVILQPGAVVGADGFGYAPVDGVYRKIPQIGIVVVEDDVEIGANACIDRATLGETRIGCGTKIDNLVQIAHNVAIGDHSVLAAQAGVAGSTHLGKRVRLGGQAGLIGHIRVGDDVSVGAQGGVIGDIPEGTTVSGYPARPHREALKVEAQLRRLPELVRRIRELESERKNRESE